MNDTIKQEKKEVQKEKESEGRINLPDFIGQEQPDLYKEVQEILRGPNCEVTARLINAGIFPFYIRDEERDGFSILPIPVKELDIPFIDDLDDEIPDGELFSYSVFNAQGGLSMWERRRARLVGRVYFDMGYIDKRWHHPLLDEEEYIAYLDKYTLDPSYPRIYNRLMPFIQLHNSRVVTSMSAKAVNTHGPIILDDEPGNGGEARTRTVYLGELPMFSLLDDDSRQAAGHGYFHPIDEAEVFRCAVPLEISQLASNEKGFNALGTMLQLIVPLYDYLMETGYAAFIEEREMRFGVALSASPKMEGFISRFEEDPELFRRIIKWAFPDVSEDILDSIKFRRLTEEPIRGLGPSRDGSDPAADEYPMLIEIGFPPEDN